MSRRLPVLLSVPHAGLEVPEEARAYCVLTPEQIAEDGDEGAREIYDLETEVEAFLTTDVARAIVDLNRSEDDRRPDGVVKTHTCFNVPVYDPFPPDEVIEELLDRYYRTYHARLRDLASGGVRLGLDCHTMLAIGPRDMENGNVSVRLHGRGHVGAKPRAGVIASILTTIRERLPSSAPSN